MATRFAMHAFAPDYLDDEFCITGVARTIAPGSSRNTFTAAT